MQTRLMPPHAASANEKCRAPACAQAATAGEWREPFGLYRWGVQLAITVEDLAFNWPLCAEHADALLNAELDAVGATLNDWSLGTPRSALETLDLGDLTSDQDEATLAWLGEALRDAVAAL